MFPEFQEQRWVTFFMLLLNILCKLASILLYPQILLPAVQLMIYLL